MIRLVFKLALLAALGCGAWWLATAPPPARPGPLPAAAAGRPAQGHAVTPPAGGATSLSTPLGDAIFRWRCTSGLREAIGERPDWPLRRVAAFCLCVADRLREEGLRDFVLSGGDTASALAAAEGRLCRR